MFDSKTDYFEINRIWSNQQNRWLYNNYIVNFVGFVFYLALIADILIFIISFKNSSGEFMINPIDNKSQFLLIFTFGFSYYWNLGFMIGLWGCITFFAFLSMINNFKIWIIDKSSVRYQFLSYYLFWRNFSFTIVGVVCILYLCFNHQMAAFNVPFNNVPTLITSDDYYFMILQTFSLGPDALFNNVIAITYVRYLIVVVVFGLELLISSSFFLMKRIGFLKTNELKYLKLNPYSQKNIKTIKKIKKLEVKIDKLKNE